MSKINPSAQLTENMKRLDIPLMRLKTKAQRVVITGGTGLLGRYVQDELTKNKVNFVILTRQKHTENNYLQTDYSKESLMTILQPNDVIIHLATNRTPSRSIAAYHEIEILTQTLYEVAVLKGVQTIIFASSISVYSQLDQLPWTEAQVPIPVSMYGISKLSQEMIGQLYARQSTVNIIQLRFAHLFGANEFNQYLINRMMQQALKKETLRLHTQSQAKREFLYARDAAKAILKAIEFNQTELFNIGSIEGRKTNLEVAQSINKIFQNEGNLQIDQPNHKDTTQPSYMDLTKARQRLLFEASYSFEQALNEIYQEMSEFANVQKNTKTKF